MIVQDLSKMDKRQIKLRIQNNRPYKKNNNSKNNFPVMLPSSQDKKNLIESMKKLAHHISNNGVRQKQIFDSLSRGDLLKIIGNLSDENQYLRRISGLFLAELFYNNDDIRLRATKLLQIYPSEGRICLNQIPQQIQKYPSTFKKCIQLMKSPLKQKEQQKFCWTINLDRKVLQIQFMDYKKYSSFTFLDPNRNIFGFTYTSNKRRQQRRRDVQQESTSKQKSVKSIDSRSSSRNGSNNIGSTFYKNYLEFRNKKTESPTSYRDHYQKRDINKPNTSQNHKNDYMVNSSHHIKNTAHNISYNLSTKEQPYDRIGTPSKKDPMQYKMGLNSLHQSIDLTSTLKSPVGSAYREAQTDRKPEPAYRNKISDSDTFNSYTADKLKYPESTKNSNLYQHEKYYKRVKEIFKK